MRVAFLSHNARPRDAIGNQIAERVRFFLEHGAEVRVFVEDDRLVHADLHAQTTRVEDVQTDGPVWDYLRHADLVIAVYAQDHRLLQFLPCLAGEAPRILFDYYGVTPARLGVAQQRATLERSERQRGLVWCCDHALAASHASATEMADATGFTATVLPLPVDTRRFQGPRERWLHERLGIEGRLLLFVGRIAANKRVSVLIEALAQLPDADWHAVIVGDAQDVYAAEAERCRQLARSLKVAERVHWLGPLGDDELPHAYRSADVFVMPSVHEGFCLPVVEALASGVPVVAARSTALPETLGDAGLTFTPDDAADLAHVIGRLTPPALVELMGERGRERAARFDRTHWQTRFSEFIERTLTQPGRSLCEHLAVEPMHDVAPTTSVLVTVRLRNLGTLAAVADGSGRTTVCAALDDGSVQETPLLALLLPGQTQVVALSLALPARGSQTLRLWTRRGEAITSEVVPVGLKHPDRGEPSSALAFLDTVREALPKTHRLQMLPTNYVDVSEGLLDRIKRKIKQKLLHNFKHAYVDVLSRQQSEVNQQLVLMVQQLSECCAVLDHTVRGLNDRLDALEAKLEASATPQAAFESERIQG